MLKVQVYEKYTPFNFVNFALKDSLQYTTNYPILQIGCGGTGSYLNYILRSSVKSLCCDHDIIELYNVERQALPSILLGLPKVTAMTSRDIKYPYKFDDVILERSFQFLTDSYNRLYVIGCVDSNETRSEILAKLEQIDVPDNIEIVYIDSGNDIYTGQVIVSRFTRSYQQIPDEFFELLDQEQKLVGSCEDFEQSASINFFQALTMTYMIFLIDAGRDIELATIDLQKSEIKIYERYNSEYEVVSVFEEGDFDVRI